MRPLPYICVYSGPRLRGTTDDAMKLLYFAWVREREISDQAPEEEIEPPASVRTIGDLVAWLKVAR